MKNYSLFFCLLFSIHGFSQSSILIDGYFSDWEDVNTSVLDDIDENYEFDIIQFQVTNDEEYLYIHVLLNTETQLMGNLFEPSIFLYIDTDNNSNTGFNPQANYGSELGVNFKQRFAYYNVDPFSTFELNLINLIAAPTVSANEFEIAIRRESIPDFVNPLFPSNTIKIAFQESTGGDYLPNDGDVFTYVFDDSPTPEYENIDFEKESENYIRVLTYNTLFDGITDPNLQGEYQRILQSINPNIITFSECVSSSASQIKTRLDQWLPSSDPNGWYVVKDDYDLITASQWQILDSWPEIDRQLPVLIDLPDSYPNNLLITNSHLKCCDGNELRQLQVDEYAAFILDAKTPGGEITLEENTPIIYAGDLNLVGYGQQLSTLITGDIVNTDIYGQGGFLDWDNTNNKDLAPAHSDKNFSYTWNNEYSEYTPSRIDYIIYSDAVIEAKKSFVVSTIEMSPERLLEANLQENDTYYSSDHLPVVMDFSFIENVSLKELDIRNIKISPNPTLGEFVISGLIRGSQIEIYDVYGRKILEITSSSKNQRFDLSSFNSGVYLIKTTFENKLSVTTLVIE